MPLAPTIEVNDGRFTPTGIIIGLQPARDPSAMVELWRAPDLAGAPDVANAALVFQGLVPLAGMNYLDVLPLDGATWWYRSRANGNQYGPSAYTDWINLGAADRVLRDALPSVAAGDATVGSPAWVQQTARIGPQGNLLPNPGYEDDGLPWWVATLGAAALVTSSANAHSGNRYAQLTSTTGVEASLYAADDAGRPRYFEVNTNDLIQFGAWLYRESGTANCKLVLELTDKDKATPTLVATAVQNTAGWVQVQAQTIVGSGKKYARLYVDVDTTGTATVARADDVYLRVALTAIYDTPPPSTLYEIRFANAVPDPDTLEALQSYIDFVASTNFMRVGQTPLVITNATNATPIQITTSANHGYVKGDVVLIRGVGGNTAANGMQTVTPDAVDATKFTLDGTTGSGAYTSGGHVVRLSLTIDPTGNLTVYARILASLLTVRSLATFNGEVVSNIDDRLAALQVPVGSVYNDTAINRLLVEAAAARLMGDANPSGGTDHEVVRLGTYTVPLGTLAARSTQGQGTGAHYGWNDPDGVADGVNTVSLAAQDNRTMAAASRLYNTAGDATAGANLPAYDNNYTVKFTVVATANGISGLHSQTVDASCKLEFSTDGGSTYTPVGGTYSASAFVSGGGSDTQTQTYTVTVNCPGAPGTGFRVRLILSGVSGGNGAGGSASVRVYNATNWSTDPWPITWQSTAGTSKARRGLKLFAASDGTDTQPHAYLEPVTAIAPAANVAEGELQYTSASGRLVIRRKSDWFDLTGEGENWAGAAGTGASTTEVDLHAAPAIVGGTLGTKGAIHILAWGAVTGVANTKTINIKLGATTVATFLWDGGDTGEFWIDCAIVNVNSETSQRTGALLSTQAPATSVGALFGTTDNTTSSEDTTADRVVKITGTTPNSGDEVTLNGMVVRVVPG